MNRHFLVLLTGLATVLLVAACEKDDPNPPGPGPKPAPWYQVDTCSGSSPYATFGKWDKNNPVFRISRSVPQEWLKEPEYAASRWNRVSQNLNIMINRNQVSSVVQLDGINTVSYGPIDAQALGRCYTWRNSQTGRIVEADIKLNSNHSLSIGGSEGSYDVASVLTHEFGHFCGLDHVNDRTHTMCGSGLPKNCRIYRTLCGGDERGIRVLY